MFSWLDLYQQMCFLLSSRPEIQAESDWSPSLHSRHSYILGLSCHTGPCGWQGSQLSKTVHGFVFVLFYPRSLHSTFRYSEICLAERESFMFREFSESIFIFLRAFSLFYFYSLLIELGIEPRHVLCHTPAGPNLLTTRPVFSLSSQKISEALRMLG